MDAGRGVGGDDIAEVFEGRPDGGFAGDAGGESYKEVLFGHGGRRWEVVVDGVCEQGSLGVKVVASGGVRSRSSEMTNER